MKKALLTILNALLMSTQLAYAEGCENYKKVAEMAMNSRQAGYTLAEDVALVKKIDTSQHEKNQMIKIMQMARNHPIYKTEKEKKAAVERFGRNAYVACNTMK